MNAKSLNAFKYLLVTLITATAITGLSILDDQIWNIVMAVVGVATYAIVGGLYSLHLISGKKAGKEAYAAVFITLLLIGVLIYNGILKVEQWIISWPLLVKILVPAILGVGALSVGIVLIVNKVKNNEKNNKNNIEEKSVVKGE